MFAILFEYRIAIIADKHLMMYQFFSNREIFYDSRYPVLLEK